MKIKKIWFHIKWLFKKRYIINIGIDLGMKESSCLYWKCGYWNRDTDICEKTKQLCLH